MPDDGHGDVFVVIDNIRAMQGNFGELYDRVQAMAEGSALNYGVQFPMASNDQWLTMRPGMLSKFGTKVEMRMANPVETETGHRDVAKKVPEQAGRALNRSGKHMLVAVPAAEGVDPSNQVAGTAAVLEAVRRRPGSPRPRGCGCCPPRSPTAIWRRWSPRAGAGPGELEMETVAIDLTRTPHFYAVGRSKSGRSSVLRTLCASIQNTYRPDEVQVVVCDPNYQLVDAIDDAYVLAYLTTITEVAGAAQALAQSATRAGRRRAPRPRSWRGGAPPGRAGSSSSMT